MFSSITSFLTSSISSLPFRVTVEDIPHPGGSVALGGGLWKHSHGVRVQTGVTGAIQAATAGATSGPAAGGVGSGPSSNEAVSIFTFDKKNATTDQQTLAKNTLLRIKTLRHPNIVKYIDSVDLPTHLYIITEQVQPLVFETPIKPSDTVGQLAASLGLHQLATTLSWLNNDAQLVHSNVHPGSLYTTDGGDWKLFGLDLCHKGTEAIPPAIVAGRASGILPVQYRAPELTKSTNSSTPPSVIHAIDSWALGCLIYQVFNTNFSSPQQLAAAGNIPPTLTPEYKKLLATNPANRLNPKYLLDGTFFQNELVSTVVFLENLAIKSTEEKNAFFIRFSEHIAEFPPKFCKYKILPQLTKSLDYGSGLTCFSSILRSVLKIGTSLTNEEYAVQVLPCVVKLFASQERSIRVHLLQNLGEYAPHLSADVVNDQLFHHLVTGFGDANATLRELTVKSLMHFAPKLTAHNMDLALKALSKLQTDPEPAIRTNTGYCLAKIAPSMTPATAEKVLIPAFTRMLRDPFPPARVAGLTSLQATLESHRPVDVARKILPCVTPLLADDQFEVRQATGKLCEASMRVMAQWSMSEKSRVDAQIAANPNAISSATLQGGGAGATDANAPAAAAAAVFNTIGSWAVGAVRSKISNADTNPPKNMATNSSMNMNSSFNQPTSASNLNSTTKPSSYASSSTSSHTSISSLASATASPTASSNSFNDDFFDDFGNEDDDEPVAVVALSTKKESKLKKDKDDKKPSKEKKSILAGGSKSSSLFSIAPPPTNQSPSTNSSSLDNWDFNIDDMAPSASAANSKGSSSSIVDDFDDWGSSSSSTKSSKSTASSTSTPTFDLLSSSSLNAHKKTPSTISTDPFASLSLNGSSPKPTSPSVLSLTSKPKPSTLGAMSLPTKSSTTATAAAAKKGKVDDWGDFLNS